MDLFIIKEIWYLFSVVYWTYVVVVSRPTQLHKLASNFESNFVMFKNFFQKSIYFFHSVWNVYFPSQYWCSLLHLLYPNLTCSSFMIKMSTIKKIFRLFLILVHRIPRKIWMQPIHVLSDSKVKKTSQEERPVQTLKRTTQQKKKKRRWCWNILRNSTNSSRTTSLRKPQFMLLIVQKASLELLNHYKDFEVCSTRKISWKTRK